MLVVTKMKDSCTFFIYQRKKNKFYLQNPSLESISNMKQNIINLYYEFQNVSWVFVLDTSKLNLKSMF